MLDKDQTAKIVNFAKAHPVIFTITGEGNHETF